MASTNKNKYHESHILPIMDMTIKDMNELLRDIIQEAKHQPYGWKSIIGHDSLAQAEDICLFHPDVGLYRVKRYQKSPLEFEGVGAKIARRVDDFPIGHTDSKFEVIQLDMKRLLERVLHSPDPIDALMQAQSSEVDMDLIMSGPVKRSDPLMSHITDIYPDEDKLLRKKFRKLTEERFKHFG